MNFNFFVDFSPVQKWTAQRIVVGVFATAIKVFLILVFYFLFLTLFDQKSSWPAFAVCAFRRGLNCNCFHFFMLKLSASIVLIFIIIIQIAWIYIYYMSAIIARLVRIWWPYRFPASCFLYFLFRFALLLFCFRFIWPDTTLLIAAEACGFPSTSYMVLGTIRISVLTSTIWESLSSSRRSHWQSSHRHTTYWLLEHGLYLFQILFVWYAVLSEKEFLSSLRPNINILVLIKVIQFLLSFFGNHLLFYSFFLLAIIRLYNILYGWHLLIGFAHFCPRLGWFVFGFRCLLAYTL